MFPRYIWPADFGLAYPHRMVSPGDLLREVPSQAIHSGQGLLPPCSPERFETQNMQNLTPYFSGISECPNLFVRCLQGAWFKPLSSYI